MNPRSRAVSGLIALVLCVSASGASSTQIRFPSFSCETGKYAIVLPRYYPTLFKIGKHTITELESRRLETGTVAVKRIQYWGLRLDVAVSSASPDVYRILALEVESRRWHVGPLSVGQAPWRWWADSELKGVRLEGPLELLGKNDSVLLQLRDGRIDRASYKCNPDLTR